MTFVLLYLYGPPPLSIDVTIGIASNTFIDTAGEHPTFSLNPRAVICLWQTSLWGAPLVVLRAVLPRDGRGCFASSLEQSFAYGRLHSKGATHAPIHQEHPASVTHS